ncbi:leukocyte immunoglobulin-like receptor subfamily A member 6 isoform X3 [Artibeus jamaicensis]|uniref:leukocyte immunoglobulin-like receptor subfamily A member 6 isoform X3 n=1 Tax=Artibeus jamaicensis TaxID=9417 RepID=UPI00235AAED3|nr:leukocyte immunoglobulin-like receptor subfamily A member 6 isoform X3 [Artibeus jamaicensis]
MRRGLPFPPSHEVAADRGMRVLSLKPCIEFPEIEVNVHIICTLVTMARSTTTLTLSVLLCLGLCWGPWHQVQAAVPPKPSIWADPGPIISKGSPVTIWCQGSLQADGYILYKERGSEPSDTSIPQASSNKTGFLIQSMSSQHTGLYQCAYSTGGRLSERSEPLLLVLTGEHSAPSLSALPGPVVTSGGRVFLRCSAQSTLDTVHLLKEGGAEPPQHRKSEQRFYERRWQAVFPFGPVKSSHGGTYRCYGSNSSTPNVWSQPSAPLHLEVTAHPGLLLLPGDSLTLQCASEPGFDKFALTKEQGPTPPQHLQGQHSPDFPLGPVNLTHGGRYRCYSGHNLSYVWSAPSAPLDILIAGKDSKPSLSVQPGPSVPLGANVTLQCRSEVRADTFHLHREGSLDPPQQLRLQDTAALSQANFTISPVTWGHNETYRCYSSHSSSPFQLSQPSDPLELVFSGMEKPEPPHPCLILIPIPGAQTGSRAPGRLERPQAEQREERPGAPIPIPLLLQCPWPDSDTRTSMTPTPKTTQWGTSSAWVCLASSSWSSGCCCVKLGTVGEDPTMQPGVEHRGQQTHQSARQSLEKSLMTPGSSGGNCGRPRERVC